MAPAADVASNPSQVEPVAVIRGGSTATPEPPAARPSLQKTPTPSAASRRGTTTPPATTPRRHADADPHSAGRPLRPPGRAAAGQLRPPRRLRTLRAAGAPLAPVPEAPLPQGLRLARAGGQGSCRLPGSLRYSNSLANNFSNSPTALGVCFFF